MTTRRLATFAAVAVFACESEPTRNVETAASAAPRPPSVSPPKPRASSTPIAPTSPKTTLSADCKNLNANYVAPKPLDLPPTDRVRGVDAGSLAPWRAIREAGFEFAYVQAAYGTKQNDDFAANWKGAKACGLLRGAYHFVTPRKDPAAQARVLARALADDPGELPPSIDIERPVECKEDECCDLTCAEWIALIDVWVAVVTKELGRAPLVYTIEPHWNQCLCSTRRHGARPLWLAGWPKFDFPEAITLGGWTEWTFYQHAGNVRFAGGVIDLNLFRGTKRELREFSRRAVSSRSLH